MLTCTTSRTYCQPNITRRRTAEKHGSCKAGFKTVASAGSRPVVCTRDDHLICRANLTSHQLCFISNVLLTMALSSYLREMTTH
ncbi:hypothetical protein M378DRAFT_275233 [Amanita muscaria Koide BX008]|uniref:Uncharacterized protein n=1 Tax=Amanita muscaria (strain Koide BX008) TaxID=946122 RepID=A0A0C2SYB8_AMAMK|nr:hypothetical protein M378DRAFT_275233 [Amanita muscaria Koide BX008]